MSDPADLVRRHLVDVFAEPDSARRAAVIAELYTDDLAFYDPEGEVHGRAALNERVALLQAQTPGLTFRISRAPRAVADLATLDWDLGPADGPVAVRGTDIALIRAGRIATVWTVVG